MERMTAAAAPASQVASSALRIWRQVAWLDLDSRRCYPEARRSTPKRWSISRHSAAHGATTWATAEVSSSRRHLRCRARRGRFRQEASRQRPLRTFILRDNAVTGANIVDASITTADIVDSARIAFAPGPSFVPNLPSVPTLIRSVTINAPVPGKVDRERGVNLRVR